MANVSVSDAITLTDSPLLTYPITVNEAVTLVLLSGLAVNASDTITATAAPLLTYPITVDTIPTIRIISFVVAADSTTVTATPSIVVTSGGVPVALNVVVGDTAYLSPGATTLTPIITETVTVTATPTVQASLLVLLTASDTITMADSFTLDRDTITVQDVPTIRLVAPLAGSDTITVTDTPTLRLSGLSVNGADSTTVTDTPAVQVRVGVQASDTVTVNDSLVFLRILTEGAINVLDVTFVTDTQTILITGPVGPLISVSDQTAVFDEPFITSGSPGVTVTLNAADLVFVVDAAPTLGPKSYITINEPVTISETSAFNIYPYAPSILIPWIRIA